MTNADEKRITVHRNSFVRSGNFDTFADRSSRTLSCPNITYRNSLNQGPSANTAQVRITFPNLSLGTLTAFTVSGLLRKHRRDIQKHNRPLAILPTSFPSIFTVDHVAFHLVHRSLFLSGGTPYAKLLHGISGHGRAGNYRILQHNRNGQLTIYEKASILIQLCAYIDKPGMGRRQTLGESKEALRCMLDPLWCLVWSYDRLHQQLSYAHCIRSGVRIFVCRQLYVYASNSRGAGVVGQVHNGLWAVAAEPGDWSFARTTNCG